MGVSKKSHRGLPGWRMASSDSGVSDQPRRVAAITALTSDCTSCMHACSVPTGPGPPSSALFPLLVAIPSSRQCLRVNIGARNRTSGPRRGQMIIERGGFVDSQKSAGTRCCDMQTGHPRVLPRVRTRGRPLHPGAECWPILGNINKYRTWYGGSPAPSLSCMAYFVAVA